MKKTKNLKYYEAVGRRKEAIARVRLYLTGKEKQVNINGLTLKAGEIYLNKKPINTLFPSEANKNKLLFPLKKTQNEDRFAIIIQSHGGGFSGQLDAISLGFARALEKVDKQAYRQILKKNGLLKRDPRVKERRKVGTGGKSRRAKQSPKR